MVSYKRILSLSFKESVFGVDCLFKSVGEATILPALLTYSNSCSGSILPYQPPEWQINILFFSCSCMQE